MWPELLQALQGHDHVLLLASLGDVEPRGSRAESTMPKQLRC